MPKKNTYNPSSAFDDSKLPKNKMSLKKELELDEKAKPFLEEAKKKLKEMFSDKVK